MPLIVYLLYLLTPFLAPNFFFLTTTSYSLRFEYVNETGCTPTTLILLGTLMPISACSHSLIPYRHRIRRARLQTVQTARWKEVEEWMLD